MLKKIHIPSPCKENWNRMQIMDAGRLCAKCETVVMDFSNVSDEELMALLRSGQYHCGRFTEEQLDTFYYLKEEQQQRKKYWNAVAAAIVAGMLQISTMYAQTPQVIGPRVVSKAIGPKEIQGKKEVPQDKITIQVLNASTNTPISGLDFTLNNGPHLQTDSYGMYELILNDSLMELKNILFNYKGHRSSRYGYHPRSYKSKTTTIHLEGNINKIVVIKLSVTPRKKRTGGRKWMGRYH